MKSYLARLRTRARQLLVDRSKATQALRNALERLRLRGLSERLSFVSDATAEASLEPQHRGSIRMLDVGRTDQTVSMLKEGGWRSFEPPMPAVFAACASITDGLVVDVGANTGFYSLLAARVRSDLKVVAVEPYPSVARILECNIARNGLASRIDVLPKALGSSPGRADLFVPPAHHGLVETSASLSSSFKDTIESTIRVDVTTLDRVVGKKRVGLVKIDVEGFEHAVLDGARRTLAEHRPFVFVEVLHVARTDEIERVRREARYIDLPLTPDRVAPSTGVEFDLRGLNHLWVPEERAADVASILRRAGLELDTV